MQQSLYMEETWDCLCILENETEVEQIRAVTVVGIAGTKREANLTEHRLQNKTGNM